MLEKQELSNLAEYWRPVKLQNNVRTIVLIYSWTFFQDQYKFVYTALVDQFSTGNTVLTREAFDKLHKTLQNNDNGKSKLAIQFEVRIY